VSPNHYRFGETTYEYLHPRASVAMIWKKRLYSDHLRDIITMNGSCQTTRSQAQDTENSSRYIMDSISDSNKKEIKTTVGWREWISLPELKIESIKAKLDTGARTSALHTYFIEPLSSSGRPKVKFGVHPLQQTDNKDVVCTADIVDYRRIVDSGGHPEMRYIIRTPVLIGGRSWLIDLSLTNREQMRFRLLIGRTALSEHLIIDPQLSFTLGRPLRVKKKRKIKVKKEQQ
jgi:hypothetical protein